MTERWLPVPGYEGLYSVSDLGRVWTHLRSNRKPDGGPLKLSPKTDGYLTVKLYKERRGIQRTVHQLVMEAFAGPCPDGLEVLHGDGNPANNVLSNLRYDTRAGNMHDAVGHGTHPHARKTHCPADHEYTAANTYVSKTGRRSCKTCAAIRQHSPEVRRKALEAQRRRRARKRDAA